MATAKTVTPQAVESELEQRILIVAPFGRDAELLCELFVGAGIQAAACESVDQLCREIERGAAAAIVAEEALVGPSRATLAKTLVRQPEWSDFPLIVTTTAGSVRDPRWRLLDEANGSAHPILLERPVRKAVLLSAVGAVMLSRNRQYQVRQELRRRRRAERELREADRHKDDFIAILAHELRNPLAPIRNATQVFELVDLGNDTLVEMREVIKRQVEHMARLLDDLLDVSRIARGKVELKLQPVELVGLVRTAAEDFRGLFREQGIELSIQLAGEPFATHADPTRISQCIGNLLQNASKFTDRGGKVLVKLTHDDSRASITVCDDGVGMDLELTGHLFQPFRQGDRSLDRSLGGLGLGLAMVKGLVELHGGSVSAASDGPGKGSTFSIGLPRLSL